MYALNLRKQTALNRRDGDVDWNAAIDKARAGVQSGDADDAPQEFVDLYENMTSGDWESELDDLENSLTDITR